MKHSDIRLTATAQIMRWSDVIRHRYADDEWGAAMRLNVAQGLLIEQLRAMVERLPPGLMWEPLSGALLGHGEVPPDFWELFEDAAAAALAALTDVEVRSVRRLRTQALTCGNVFATSRHRWTPETGSCKRTNRTLRCGHGPYLPRRATRPPMHTALTGHRRNNLPRAAARRDAPLHRDHEND